jgi:putative nucleotidyltransferase with HDIG domain
LRWLKKGYNHSAADNGYKGDRMQNLKGKETKMNQAGLDLIDKIWKKVGSSKRSDTLITSIIQMTRYALDASVSSLFLLDEKNQELLLRCSNGPANSQLKRFQINNESGITGWVARNRQPIIVNDVDKDPRFNRLIDEVYGLDTRSIICAPLIVHRKVIGVIKVVNKARGADFGMQDLQTLAAVATTAALTEENLRLSECLQDSYKSTINALVSLVDAKETTGGGHSKRVAKYALMGATYLSLSEEEKQTIEYAAILHDIGKLGIPDSILNKSDTLTDEEWSIMHRHPEIGYTLLKKIPFLEEASRLILNHHERYDGNGYPYGQKGETIPIGSRLIAVADAFDNMTTKHAYRAALNYKQAFTELNRCAIIQFCPIAVKAFQGGFLQFHMANRQKPAAGCD